MSTAKTLSKGPFKQQGLAALAAAVLVGWSAAASAQSIDKLGAFQAWNAFSYGSGDQKICFMSSAPTKAEGNYSRRGDIFAMVTHRPSRGTRDVVSIEAGYTYKEGSQVSVKIDDRSFSLFTQEGNAWALDPESDAAMVKAMKAGLTMVVEGVSSRDTATKDSYSLKGFTAAYDAISKACPK